MVRVPRDLDCTLLLSKTEVFCLDEKNVNSNEIWYPDDKGNAERWHSNTNWRHKKNYPVEKKRVVQWNVDPLLWNCLVLVEFLRIIFHYLWNLSVSLLLCVKVALGCWKLKNASIKWQSPSQIGGVKQQNHTFLANWTDSALSSHSLLWLLASLSVHISLDSTAPCGRPSASLEFLPSLTLPHYDYCISLGSVPKHNSRRRSLSMLVLSNSDTQNLNGYMGWCGCHEILIALYYSQKQKSFA